MRKGDRQTDANVDVDTEVDSEADTDIGTANTMRERTNESRLKLWVMLGANRLLITGLLACVVCGVFVVVGTEFYPPGLTELKSTRTIERIFATMIGAIITGTTLVVTISQLVISEENGPLGDQHERMSSTMNVRSYTRELIERPVPADPSAFLRYIVTTSDEYARELREVVAENDDGELREEVDEFTTSLLENAQQVQDQLEGAKFGTFDVLFAALNYNYGWKIFQVERIAHDYEQSLSAEETELLESLKSTLSMFGPAREHVKTLYFEWALINLSQLILYMSVPALVVAASMLAFVDSTSIVGSTFGITHVTLLVSVALTVTLLPFLLLVSYIARVATIAKRTLAIGPLILRDSQR